MRAALLSHIFFTIHFIHFPSILALILFFFLLKLSCEYILCCMCHKRDRKSHKQEVEKEGTRRRVQERARERERRKGKIAKWSYDKKSISHFLNAFSEIIQQFFFIYPLEAHQTHTLFTLARYKPSISMVNRDFFSLSSTQHTLCMLWTPEIDLTYRKTTVHVDGERFFIVCIARGVNVWFFQL